MSHDNAVAHDPSAPAEYLPGFAREERDMRHAACIVATRQGGN